MSIGTDRTVKKPATGSNTALERSAAWALIVISSIHVVFFGIQVVGYGHLSAWLGGALWGPEVLDVEMSQAQGAFWQLLGSFVVPLVLLSALLLRLLRARVPIPGFIGYGLAVWLLICSAVMEPAGFALGLIPAGMLILAHHRR
ncbi:MAG: hypothetical protein M3313_13660 [Actinomycetota bacterium]|nr:hypothetical protein [Actinomycetota bacterium]